MRMGSRKKNQRIRLSGDGMVYSTQTNWAPEFIDVESSGEIADETTGTLYISLDRKQRAGKPVTLVEGYQGSELSLALLGKELKALCGAGGAVKDGMILVQGDHRDKVIAALEKKGFTTKRKGG